jgi:hypothetical protein
MPNRVIVCAALTVTVFMSSMRSARAEGGVATAPRTQPVSEEPDPNETRKIVGVSLLAGGVVAAATGAALALKYSHSIGNCDRAGACTQEDGRVPLGLGVAMIGAAMAFVGTILWLQVPGRTTRVAVTSSGIGVRF